MPGLGEEYTIVGKPIAWIDTPWCADDLTFKEHNNPRYTNAKEVSVVCSLMRQLELVSHSEDRNENPLSVAVMSPYNRQIGLLDSSLESVPRKPWLKLVQAAAKRVVGAGSKERWAHTVDSFQGNQADIVITSLVRNNLALAGTGLGFLKEYNRINVMMSRAEQLLILVGSWEFFNRQVSTVSLENMNDELWFWKKLLDMLATRFDEGKAVRIPYQAILKEELA